MKRFVAMVMLLAFTAACESSGGVYQQPRVDGTVTYQGTPPPGSVLEVRIVENANWPNPFIVGVHRIVDPGPSPVRFTVDFNAAEIDSNTQYLLEAEVVVNGRIEATNDRPYFVITGGYPARGVQVPMRRL
ncbi:MAG: hypothetical protein GY791_17450 [Alphaproteobacteria bacterium]|nr:hypothetical protein [Alphaproteobacteria bacterium]